MSPPRKVGAGGNRHRPAVSGPRRQARQNVPDESVLIVDNRDTTIHFFYKPKLKTFVKEWARTF
jgi:hypothetical protein